MRLEKTPGSICITWNKKGVKYASRNNIFKTHEVPKPIRWNSADLKNRQKFPN